MREPAGLLVLNAMFLVVGGGFLYALGLVEVTVTSLLRGAGLAYLCGIAFSCLAVVCLLFAGLTMDARGFVAVVAALLGVSLAVGYRRRGGEAYFNGPFDGSLFGAVAACAVAVFLIGQIWVSPGLPTAWDAAHNWTMKATVLYNLGELTSAFRDTALFTPAHLEYPILQPVLGQLVFRFTGSGEQGLIVVQLWLVASGFVAAGASLIAGHVGHAWLAVVPLGAAVAAASSSGILRGDADVTMACFVGVGALALASALETERRALYVVAALLLGAAANTKNEGLAFAAIVLVVAGGVAIAGGRLRAAVPVVATAAMTGLLLLPWRIWASANGPFASDVTPLSQSLDPSFLLDRTDVLDLGARTLLGKLTDLGSYGPLVPALLAVCAAAIWFRAHRAVATFYLASFVGVVCTVLWVYWTSNQPDVAAHIERTSIRTVTGPLFIAAVGLAHLLVRLVPLPGPEPRR